jgi:hypothetical protein
MTNRVILESRHAAEARNEVFDFLSQLNAGETISTASVTAAISSGVTASALPVIAAPSIGGSKVTVNISAGVIGVVYLLTCSITTSLGQTLLLNGYQPVIPEIS